MLINNINISQLITAFNKFEAFRNNHATEQEQAGTIQVHICS